MSSFAVNIYPLTIALGQSLSQSFPLNNDALAGITVASGSSITQLSFQGSLDDSTYFDIYNEGSEYKVTVAGGVFTSLSTNVFLGVRFVKVRAGNAGSPSTQSVATNLQALTKEV